MLRRRRRHNGRAEQANRTIVESMRATLESSKIKKSLWPEILKSCCIMLNQVNQKDEIESPWTKMHGKNLPRNFIKPICTPAVFINQRRIKGRKFHIKGEEGVLVGFDPLLLSYRILCKSGLIVKTKHVRFLKKTDSSILNSSNDSANETWHVGNREEAPTAKEHHDLSNHELLNGEENNLVIENNQFNISSEDPEDELEVQQNLIPQNPPHPEPVQSIRKL
ncbi:uncharacterized protein VP01_2749g1 [Puccinia sorghi]|uniref:Integrase catalytic domain-containing protein n=1 Tax=Puccinia sorghi TaxID=27349 RepID=A0A0L6V4V8_9BASI|nr:uncharacterized protein VP01_2749g1 [Puccinia sorghi]